MIYEFFKAGGPLMWPLLACSALSVLITVERALFWLRQALRRDDALAGRIVELAGRRDWAAAGKLASTGRDAAAAVLSAGLEHRPAGGTEGMEIAAADELARMKRGMLALDTIITLAPLLGILGTVLGIIQSFRMLSAGASLQDPKGVVGGIAMALITTAGGLIVSIVTLVPFSFFRARVNAATRRIARCATLLEIALRTAPEAQPCD